MIELLIAIAVGAILLGAAAAIIAPALRVNTTAVQAQVAGALGKELLENVRVFGEANWSNLASLSRTSSTGPDNHYTLSTSSSPFSPIALGTSSESVVVGTTTYTRYFYLNDVTRGYGSGNNPDIMTSVSTVDPSTLLVTVVYGWPGSSLKVYSEYLTRYKNQILFQTDWSAGPTTTIVGATNTTSRFTTSTNIDYTTSSGSLVIPL